MQILSDKSIVTFCAKDSETLGIVLGLDEIMRGPKTPHGALFEFDARYARERAFLELALVSVAYLGDGSTLAALSEEGEVRLFRDGEIREERMEARRGPMRALGLIGNTLFASGVSAQVFRRAPNGAWHDISPDVQDDDGLRLSIMEGIDGFGEQEIYAAGENGVIWYFDGAAWHAVRTATNLSFYAIHCGADGVVYAVGQLGILARGRHGKFEIVKQSSDLADLWGVTHFGGALYASSMRAMLSLEDDEFVPVVGAMELARTFYGLDVADGVLWSAGEKDILRFDGSEWTRFIDPEWVQ